MKDYLIDHLQSTLGDPSTEVGENSGRRSDTESIADGLEEGVNQSSEEVQGTPYL
jgi:hypothetical protein